MSNSQYPHMENKQSVIANDDVTTANSPTSTSSMVTTDSTSIGASIITTDQPRRKITRARDVQTNRYRFIKYGTFSTTAVRVEYYSDGRFGVVDPCDKNVVLITTPMIYTWYCAKCDSMDCKHTEAVRVFVEDEYDELVEQYFAEDAKKNSIQ